MKEGSLMRVLLCKIHCPFICFCKPSAAHLYTSAPLRLENTTPQQEVVPSTAFSVSNDESSSTGANEEASHGNALRSCIRKKIPNATKQEVGKKKVQWMDNFGKELAEIKEFESSETGDTDNEEESSRCLCIIL